MKKTACALFLVGLLLVCFPTGFVQGFSLAEYSYLLRQKSPDVGYIWFTGASCAGFAKDFDIARNARQNKEFAGAVEHAENALTHLEQAEIHAKWQAVVAKNPMGMSLSRYFAFKCFSEGVLALSASVESTKTGLKAVDENIARLEHMVDASYKGAAAGLEAGLEEAGRIIEARNAEGKTFGHSFVNASQRVDQAWTSLEYRYPSPSQMTSTIRFLIGDKEKKALFRQEGLLNDRVNAAITALEDEYGEYLLDVERSVEEVRRLLKQAQDQDLQAVQEDVFLLVGAGAVVAGQERVQSFAADLTRAQALLRQAERDQGLAERTWKNKARAFASQSILLLRDSLDALDGARRVLASVDERSSFVEQALQQRVLEEKNLLAQAISLKKQDNPYAATLALAVLEENSKALPERIKTRGERIRFYLHQITALQEMRRALKAASNDVRQQKTELDVKAQGVNELIEGLERDGLNAFWARSQLGQIQSSAAELADEPSNALPLSILGEDLQAVNEGLVAQATEEYASLLEDYFSRLEKIKELLDAESQAKLVEWRPFFENNRLNVRGAIGWLKKMREDFEAMLSKAQTRAPNLLREHFRGSMLLETRIEEPVFLDEPAHAATRVSFKNDLGLSYDGLLAVSSPELSELLSQDFVVVNASPGLEARGGKIFLQGVAEDGEYFLEVTQSVVVAATKSVSTQTLFAAADQAQLKTVVGFGCLHEAWVLIKQSFDYPVTVLDSDADYRLEGSELRLLKRCVKGSNSVYFVYSVDEPVQVGSQLQARNNSITLNYSLYNRFVALQGFEHQEFESMGCIILGVDSSASPELTVKTKTMGSYLSIEFKATRLPAKSWHSAVVTVTCDSLALAANTRLLQTRAFLDSIELNSLTRARLEEELAFAEDSIARQAFGQALERIHGVQQALEAEQAMQAQQALESFQEDTESQELQDLVTQTLEVADSLEDPAFAQALRDAAVQAGSARELSESLDALALQRIKDLEKQCGKECDLGQAKAFYALGDSLRALQAVEAERGAWAQRKEASAAGEAELQELLDEFVALKPAIDSSLDSFETAFKVSQANEGKRRKSLHYQNALQEKKALEAAVKALDKALASPAKYSREFVSTKLFDLRNALSGLDAVLDELRQKAEGQVAVARESQRQYGDSSTILMLQTAESALEKGEYYTAFLAADELRHSLLELPSPEFVEGEQNWRLALGLLGVAALAFLVYYFAQKKPRKRKQI